MARDGRGLRLGVLGIVAVSLFATLFARLWYLQMMSPERLKQDVQTFRVRTVQLAPMRGRIVDRVGNVMADNRRVLSVTIDRAEIRGATTRKRLFTRLSGPLQTPVEDLEARYTDKQYDPYLPLPLADDVPETTAIYLGERREDYPGVEVSESWQRVYRYAPLASHVVGYMGAIPAETADSLQGEGLQAERAGRQGRHRAAVRGSAPRQARPDHLRGRCPQPDHPRGQPAGAGPRATTSCSRSTCSCSSTPSRPCSRA